MPCFPGHSHLIRLLRLTLVSDFVRGQNLVVSVRTKKTNRNIPNDLKMTIRVLNGTLVFHR
jgi:hypothetical protein